MHGSRKWNKPVVSCSLWVTQDSGSLDLLSVPRGSSLAMLWAALLASDTDHARDRHPEDRFALLSMDFFQKRHEETE